MANANHKHIPCKQPLASFRPQLVQQSFENTSGSETTGFLPPTGCGSAPEGGGGAGLVSSKTSHHEINFSPREQAKRRVKKLKRSVWAAGSLHGLANRGHRPPVAWFVTLTYVGVDDWQADHISRATHQFRQHCARLNVPCRYLWVAELQKRGAVHYHLLAWLPQGVQMPHWDQTRTTKAGREAGPFWSHGMTNTEKAKSGVGYLMKYLSKLGEHHTFPPHLRLYGVGGLNPDARMIRTWYNLPEWVKSEHGVGDVRRMGVGLIVVDTGEMLEPMYKREFYPGGVRLTPLRDVAERFHDGAYSSIK